MVKDAAKKMSGVQMQMPPQFSAKQVDGKRAYESARKGIEVKLEPKEVNISRFEVDATSLPEVHFEITCSKGTYIRSMARDLGEILGCGAHLTKLVRTKVGAFELKDAVSPEAFQANLED
jgi:tRNA pseudouridine55 synthase